MDHEISELRNKAARQSEASRSVKQNQSHQGRTARHPESHQAREKASWNTFLENADGEDVWTAVRYTNPHFFFFNFIILYSAVLGHDSLNTHSLS